MIKIVPAEAGHAVEICKSLRAHEKMEFDLMSADAEKELVNQVELSDAYVALVDGKPACLWGFRDHGMSGTHLWMVTTELVEKHARRFLKESILVVEGALEKHPMLYGYVDAKFKVSCRWMEWIGFQPVSEIEFKDIKLIRYEMRA